MTPSDITVVIPTRDRWDILRRTLDGLRAQSVTGFHIVVAVDGEDQDPPRLPGATVVVGPAAGSGAARNAGIEHVSTPLTLLLDDDMVPTPDVVERHVAVHARNPEETVGVLGHVVWHPEVPDTRVSRWLDWSSLMYDFAHLDGRGGTDVGWGRFCSCNVSLKTALLRASGGFDEAFIHQYEDTDLARRLGSLDLTLLYEPGAVCQHLQTYDWPSVRARFEMTARGERLMGVKHPDFEPWYLPQMRHALESRGPSPLWPLVVDRVPRRWRRLRAGAEGRAHQRYLRALAPAFTASYRRAQVLPELMEYGGDRYRPPRLLRPDVVDADAAEPRIDPLYGPVATELRGRDVAACRTVLRHVGAGARVLDVGFGSAGIRLSEAGAAATVAVDGAMADFARWRAGRRGLSIDVVDRSPLPAGFDVALALGTVDADAPGLDDLEAAASVVGVGTHRDDIVAAVRRKAILAYRPWDGDGHFLLFRSGSASTPASAALVVLGRLAGRRDVRGSVHPGARSG